MGDHINKGIITKGGTLNANNVIVGDRAVQNIGTPPPKQSLKELIAEMQRELSNARLDADDRETIDALLKQLEGEASKKKPNKQLGQITAKGLQEATGAIATITPRLLQVATQIAAWFAVL